MGRVASRSVVDDEPNDDEPNPNRTTTTRTTRTRKRARKRTARRKTDARPKKTGARPRKSVAPPGETARADGGGGRRPSRAWRGSRRDHLRGGRDGAFVNPTRSASFGSVLAIPSRTAPRATRLSTAHNRRGARAEYAGQRLLVRVDGWRATSRHPDARVLRVLGHAGDADAETAALLARFDIPDAPFTPAALANLPPEG